MFNVSLQILILEIMRGIQAKWREVASLDRHVLLKKLKDVLDSLRGRVAGRNKDDADEAISMVSLCNSFEALIMLLVCQCL